MAIIAVAASKEKSSIPGRAALKLETNRHAG
jgi:hypothetical protein